jgi:hypothetical protein
MGLNWFRNIAIKTLNRHYDLYQVVALPTRILNRTYAKFKIAELFCIEFTSAFLLYDSELTICQGKDIKICPAEKAVYSMDVSSCALSLYLQLEKACDECKRAVFAKPPQPILERYGSILLYFMAEQGSFISAGTTERGNPTPWYKALGRLARQRHAT